jgi:alkylation response protein AidB-like acyl-CoA dehydrogenase
VGEVFAQLFALRARARATQYRLARGEQLGPEKSVDNNQLATTEQAVFDLALDAVADDALFGASDEAERWRSDYLYSRAATIYGGSAEIQRNIVARRLLDLGPD